MIEGVRERPAVLANHDELEALGKLPVLLERSRSPQGLPIGRIPRFAPGLRDNQASEPRDEHVAAREHHGVRGRSAADFEPLRGSVASNVRIEPPLPHDPRSSAVAFSFQ